MDNIKYYNQHALQYIKETMSADLTLHYKAFEKHLNRNASILDLGCGAGRDSLYFSREGYTVTSIDGSEALIDHCRTLFDHTAIHTSFEAYAPDRLFDGIWAYASLLHVQRSNLSKILNKYIDRLNPSGVFFMSFKVYHEDFTYKNRHFTCFTPTALETYLKTFSNIEILSLYTSYGTRPSSKDLQWVNAVIKRINKCE